MGFTKELELLDQVRHLNMSTFGRVEALLSSNQLLSVVSAFAERERQPEVDLGFNVFAIVSDLYYRENFHSDILRAMLDPQSPHGEGDRFLRLFLDFLISRGAAVDAENYSRATVVREEGRLDLLLRDATSRKAIIIENKMNGAGDMRRQLPRYLQYVKEDGFECDAIVYLRLNRDQRPDIAGWTREDIKEVNARLLCVSAYLEDQADLYNGWITACEREATNPDAQHISRQYGRLIQKLGGKIMNKAIMEDFFSLMTQGDNLKTAASLRAMLDDLPQYRAERVLDAFKSDLHPFHKISIWGDNDAYFENFFWGEAHLGLDVIAEPDRYVLLFWDRKDGEGNKNLAKTALEKAGCLGEFTFSNGGFRKVLQFPAEEHLLFDEIRTFKSKLADALSVEIN